MYTIRYLVSLGLIVIGCSMGCTLFVMWAITEIIPLEGVPYWIVSGVVLLILVILGLRFYVPRLRNTW
jgi:hypothetical protein